MTYTIGNFRDNLMCDIVGMDVCHILSGKSWQFDGRVHFDGYTYVYTLILHQKKYDLYHKSQLLHHFVYN